jgi:hypothetical protein
MCRKLTSATLLTIHLALLKTLMSVNLLLASAICNLGLTVEFNSGRCIVRTVAEIKPQNLTLSMYHRHN